MKPSVALLLLAAAAASGCHYRSFTTPTGAKYTAVSLGAAAHVQAIDARHNPTTGEFALKVGAAATDATAVAGQVLPAAVRGVVP